jgi:aminomethyltransferase
MEEPGIPRAGMAVQEGGEVTSGTLSPTLDVAIGLAYVTAGRADPGTEITVDLRGRPRRARIVPKPFYKREEK